MSYAILRFSGAQRLETFEVDSDSVHSTFLRRKTQKPQGLDWPLARHRAGMTGSIGWVLPLLEFRTAFAKTNGNDPRYTSPRLNRTFGLPSAEPPLTRPLGVSSIFYAWFFWGLGFICYTPRKTFFQWQPIR